GRPNRQQCSLGCVGIFLIKKASQSLDVVNSLGRKQDHPILRGAGRGNSFAEPQLATQAFTSSSGTAERVCRKLSKRRRSSATSGPEISITESSSATALQG